MQEPFLIHFKAGRRETRLLAHFYYFLIFSDAKVDNYFKRLIRDFLHYEDAIFCAAGKYLVLFRTQFFRVCFCSFYSVAIIVFLNRDIVVKVKCGVLTFVHAML